jgi:multidrug efflux system outer membrane protein
VTQPILFNGKLIDLQLFPATLRKAQLDELKAREDNRDLVNKSLTAAVQSLFNVLYLRKTIDNAGRSLDVSGKRLDQAKRNLELGLVSELDLWDTQISVAQQKEGLLDLRYSLAQAERQLAQSLGREDLGGIELDDRIPSVDLDLSPAELVKRAQTRHPVVQQNALSLEGSKLDKTIAGQQEATTVTLSFSAQPKYPYTRVDTTFGGSFTDLTSADASLDWVFGVGVSIPVYRGGKKRYDAIAADALQSIAGENLLLARQQVVGDVQSLLLSRENLKSKASLLEDNANLLSRRVEIEQGLLAAGKSTDLDVAGKEVDLATKRVELWKARADLLVATLSLYRQAGEELQRVIERAQLERAQQ